MFYILTKKLFCFWILKCFSFLKKNYFFQKFFEENFLRKKIFRFFFCKICFLQKNDLKNALKNVPTFWGHFWAFFDPPFWGGQKRVKNGPKMLKITFFSQKCHFSEKCLIFPTPIFGIFAFPHPPPPKIWGGVPPKIPQKRGFLTLF